MPDSVVIRLLTQSDIAGIAHWVAATPLWQRYGVTETAFSARLTKGLASDATIYVAEHAGDVLGFLWLVERGAFNRSAYVQLIGVHPGTRSQGVGRILMEYVEANTSTRDVFLLVSDFNVEAQRFYSRLGYKQVGQLEDYVVSGVTEMVFCKRVK